MPTMILLDRSLSMWRPVSREVAGAHTRHSLASAGLEWFLGYMAECCPMEYTALLSFSSSCDVVAPFTRNYDQLKESLLDIKMQDRTDIHNALASLVDIMIAEWGVFAPCQVVLVTDGSPGVRHEDTPTRKKQLLNFPFSIQLHVVAMSTVEELNQPLWASKLQRLCESTGITQNELLIPSGSLGRESVKAVFLQLAKSAFKPYNGTLKCGHLSSEISLSPSPHSHRPKFDITISAEQKYPKLNDNFPPNLQFPSEIALCGFLDMSAIPAPPLYSRHMVLDPVSEESMAELESKLLSPQRVSVSEDGGGERKTVNGSGGVSSSSDDNQKPSFRVLLHGSLKCESKIALVKLGEKWYGLLFSQTSSSKKSNLVLSVLYPGSELPWLGPLAYLGTPPPPPQSTDPRRPQKAENPFPVPPSHPPSFQSPSNLLWAKEGVLQTDIAKVIRYSRKLPDKEASLVKELNKLRLVALTYSMPELMEVLCLILSREEGVASQQPQGKTLLQQCVYFLSNNKNPQERLVISHQ